MPSDPRQVHVPINPPARKGSLHESLIPLTRAGEKGKSTIWPPITHVEIETAMAIAGVVAVIAAHPMSHAASPPRTIVCQRDRSGDRIVAWASVQECSLSSPRRHARTAPRGSSGSSRTFRPQQPRGRWRERSRHHVPGGQPRTREAHWRTDAGRAGQRVSCRPRYSEWKHTAVGQRSGMTPDRLRVFPDL